MTYSVCHVMIIDILLWLARLCFGQPKKYATSYVRYIIFMKIFGSITLSYNNIQIVCTLDKNVHSCHLIQIDIKQLIGHKV